MTINDCIAARLPFEILSEIFSVCAEDALDDEKLPTTPLRLGAVCGYWREVAWRTSAIWATFRLILYGQPESLINWDFVRDWLKRSKERPLVITISSCWPTEAAVSPLVDIVNEFSDRWYQLSLHLPYHTISHLARKGTPIYAPRMHYLDLQGHDIPATEGLEPIIIPGTKPKSVDFSLPFSILSVDWSHLTSCNARKQTLDECLCLLRHAPNILDLTLDEMMRPVIEMATTLHVVHPRIRSFQFTTNETAPLGRRLFKAITLPSLKSLSLSIWPGTLPLRSLRLMIERSGCDLEDLRLFGFDNVIESDLIRLLQSTPGLSHLEFEMLPFSPPHVVPDFLVESLSRTSICDGPTSFLPRLSSISLMARDPIPWNNILDVFGQVDKPQNRPLRYVKIVFETPATLNDLPEFDEETLRRLYSLYYDGYFLDLRITSDHLNDCIQSDSSLRPHSHSAHPMVDLRHWEEKQDERYLSKHFSFW